MPVSRRPRSSGGKSALRGKLRRYCGGYLYSITPLSHATLSFTGTTGYAPSGF